LQATDPEQFRCLLDVQAEMLLDGCMGRGSQ
jgi:hypothetical protein